VPVKSALEGRAAIITGASQGLGLAIARAYVMAGAGVLLCARDAMTLERAREDVARLATSGQRVVAQVTDVSEPADIDRLVRTALDVFPRLHVLVNNAGIYGPLGPIEEVDWDQWVKAIQINLLGSVRACRAVLPHFKMHKYGKIVQLSGGGASGPLPRIGAYAASKAAIVRFVETLAEEVQDDHIDVNAMAPGALNTRLLDQVLAAGPERVGQAFYDRAVQQKLQGGSSLERGAELAVFLGSAASDGISGRLLSAVWDPWETLPDHLDDLRRTDVYTLRRIVPKDRGLNWEGA
jgi:NAD(P)-dependent dehydrogenase (short-subunit alcohol dehydrogenase family)